jgi:hypothetical protein
MEDIENGFNKIGTRFKLRNSLPSRSSGKLSFMVDIETDRKGAYFEICGVKN